MDEIAKTVNLELQLGYNLRDEPTVVNNLILKASNIVIRST